MWDAVLQDLRKSRPENIHRMQDDVYSRIEVSYNYLRSKEAEQCFLLCCLFPEDYNVLVEDLVRYGIGMRWFEDVDDLQQARNRVRLLINQLKRSFLLLDGDEPVCESVKMHDLVRDVAIQIASRDEYPFLVRSEAVLKDWPRTDRYEHYSAIALVSKEIKKHPENLQCPKVELLQLVYGRDSQSLPNNFFEGMKNLRVLTLRNLDVYEPPHLLPESLKILKNLRSLYLENCPLKDISLIGALEQLEVLGIVSCKLRELTKENLKLKNLMLLELRNCGLRYIEPGALSGLSKLEELYVMGSFREWGSVVDGKNNASLSELVSFYLRRLHVKIGGAPLPTGLVCKDLTRFRIIVGFEESSSSEIALELRCSERDIMESGINVLCKKTEIMKLKVENLKNVSDSDKDGFPCLQVLEVLQCYELEYIIDEREQMQHPVFPQLSKLHLHFLPNLKETWHGQLSKRSSKEELTTFGSLRDVYVLSCDELKFVFALSVAKCFSLFTSLQVSFCKEIRGILFKKGVEDEMPADEVELPHLTNLLLRGLPKLISFCLDNANIDQFTRDNSAMIPSLNRQTTSNEIEKWSTSSEEDKITEKATSFMKMTPTLFPPLCPRLPNLKNLGLHNCDILEVVCSLSVVVQFDQLEELIVESCERMEYIVAARQAKNKRACIFPKLDSILLRDLPKMVSLCNDACPKSTLYDIEPSEEAASSMNMTPIFFSLSCPALPNLKKLKLDGCNVLEVVFPASVAAKLDQLEELIVESCERVEYVVAGGQAKNKRACIFPKLNRIQMKYLPKMVSFCNDACPKSILYDIEPSQEAASSMKMTPKFFSPLCPPPPNLKELELDGCNVLEVVFSPSVAAQLDQLEELIVRNCERMDYFVAGGQAKNKRACIFPKLNCIQLEDLPKMVSFCNDACPKSTLYDIEHAEEDASSMKMTPTFFSPSCHPLPNLKNLGLYNCDVLEVVFSLSIVIQFDQLEELIVGSCERMEYIVAGDKQKIKDHVFFQSWTVFY